MPQWKVTLATTKKTPKKTAFSARAFYDIGCGQCNKNKNKRSPTKIFI
jgi:hypothetical protein